MPRAFRTSTICWSLSGAAGSSSLIIFWITSLTVSDETSAPVAVVEKPVVKKNFIGKMPCGVCMYLLVVTRLIVDSCMPMSSATSLSTMGFRCEMPWSRNSRWNFTMLSATL